MIINRSIVGDFGCTAAILEYDVGKLMETIIALLKFTIRSLMLLKTFAS
jgi:hypothetical protein